MCAETGTAAHRAQTISRHHYPSSPLLSPVQQPPRTRRGRWRGVGGGGYSLSLFLSFFHFLSLCFCNLSSAASSTLSLVTSEKQTGRLPPVFPPVCQSVGLSDCRVRGFCVTLLYFLLSQIKIGVDGLDTRMTPLIFCKERMEFFLFCFVFSSSVQTLTSIYCNNFF